MASARTTTTRAEWIKNDDQQSSDVVRISFTKESIMVRLGMNLEQNQRGEIYVHHLKPGGLLYTCGEVAIGDVLLQINQFPCSRMDVKKAVQTLRYATGNISLLIQKKSGSSSGTINGPIPQLGTGNICTFATTRAAHMEVEIDEETKQEDSPQRWNCASSAIPPPPTLEGVYGCDSCGDERPITGTRFHCPHCGDYDICLECYSNSSVHSMHGFYCIVDQPNAQPFYIPPRYC